MIARFATALVLAAAMGCPAAALAADLERTLERLRDAALASDYAYRQVAMLTDEIGPRLTGSTGEAEAVRRVAAELERLGLTVTLQKVMAPHWERGEERAELLAYPGRPDGVTQRIVLTALGSSGATPAQGLEAEIVVAESLEALDALGRDKVAGRIVFFPTEFDQPLAAAGHAGTAYSQAVRFRNSGPNAAARLGAAAALVRSAGGGAFRKPHTGNTRFDDGVTPIPAAALAAEDAALIQRLAHRGAVRMRLVLTPTIHPDTETYNVIADLRGREQPDELVIVSGHLDSWDLGTGALDDAVGVGAAMAVAHLMQELRLQPRRTVRVVAWANEENGLRGAIEYAERADIARHFAAVESDSGAGRPLGVRANLAADRLALLDPLRRVLEPLGATLMQSTDRPAAPDLRPLHERGVPGFAPLLDMRDYFTYHHTAADTLDKVDPVYLRRNVAVMAALTWWLAETEEL